MNTVKFKYIIPVILLFAFLFQGCEDFLEVENAGKISQEEFYSDDNSVRFATLAAYDILQSLYAEDWKSLWLVKTLMSDEINCGGGSASDQIGYQNLNKLLHTPSNDKLNPIYKKLYSGVFNCNI
ncbi:MAG: hypothetical protein MI922_10295, partial [Bacteroidales bacterium]|nr:hypothetical protein [Bacteroidales bacterium]